MMTNHFLTALPVYNEAQYVTGVLDQVVRYSPNVLVVDDGSRDGTPELLGARGDIRVIRHPENRGYGAALRSAFDYSVREGYDVLVTIDCDGQHQPAMIPHFVEACLREEADIVSGSRYLRAFPGDTQAPAQRRRINEIITAEVNCRLGLRLTDAFCGFKAYSVSALAKFEVTDPGYAMPLELWVRAAELGLKIVELPVPLIYLDETRSFGGALDRAEARLAVYRETLQRAIEAAGLLFGRAQAQDGRGTAAPLALSPTVNAPCGGDCLG